jgi:hypothetical protein
LLALMQATLDGLTLRARIVLMAEQMEVRGLLRMRVITPDLMEGYRLNNGRLWRQ